MYWTGVLTGVCDKVELDDPLSNVDKCQWKHALTPTCFSADVENFPVFHPDAACGENLAASFGVKAFTFSLLLLTVYQRF